MIGHVTSKNGINVRLTAERWAHIVEAHDYMAGNQDLVFETIEGPDCVVQGEKDELIAIRRYQKTSISEKNMVVVYRETINNDGFVITAFMTSKPERIFKKGILWEK